jgi:anti-sigma B factor antagonist
MERIVTSERRDGVDLLRLSGELDLATRRELEAGTAPFPAADRAAVVLDLSAVTFLDCTCLNVLLELARRCARAGVGLLWCGLHGVARRVVLMLELDSVLTLVGTEEEALLLARMCADGLPEAPHSRLLPTVGRIPRPAHGARP